MMLDQLHLEYFVFVFWELLFFISKKKKSFSLLFDITLISITYLLNHLHLKNYVYFFKNKLKILISWEW